MTFSQLTPPTLLRTLAASTAIVCSLCGCEEQKKMGEVVQVAKGLYTYDAKQAVHGNFSGTKAMEYVEAQVALGPRPSGSEAAERCRQLLEKQLKAAGWEVQRQTFKDYTPKGNIEFHNIRARFPMAGSDTWKRNPGILIGSHYDTKMFTFPFVGANDGASSTGAVLEMGRVLGGRPALAQFVELVFFDGEEAVVEYTMGRNHLPTDGLYGSRYYAAQIKESAKELRPLAMILLDMVGEKEVRINMPDNSHKGLANGILSAASELNYKANFANDGGGILDDHVPFLLAGIPSVDIIDLKYDSWHTEGDALNKLSPESLEIVGRTTLLAVEKTFLSVGSWE